MTTRKFGNSAALILKSKSILLVLISLTTLTMITAGLFHLVLADPLHCDIQGWPSCYNVGYPDGLADLGTNCPGGHSDNFCAGWEAAASSGGHIQNSNNNTAYMLGFNAGKNKGWNESSGYSVWACSQENGSNLVSNASIPVGKYLIQRPG
jgi:hypothetical protein